VIGEVESNNTFATAQAIDRARFSVYPNGDLSDPSLPSGIVRGTIGSLGDVDYFKVTLSAGEKLVLDVDHSRTGLDAELRLYGPTGALIADNDDRVSPDTGSDQSAASDGHNTDSFLTYRAATAGTYTFAILSYGGASKGAYDLDVSIAAPASAEVARAEARAAVDEADTQALIGGSSWSTTSLSYSFTTSASDYSDYPASSGSNFQEPKTFQPLSTAQQGAVRQVLGLLSNLTNLSFTEATTNRSGAQLRYAMTTDEPTAHAYYPGNGPGGDAWFNTVNYNNPVQGNYAFATFLHETGHAMGLKHGQESPALTTDHDSVEYSVMTYRSYVGAPLDGYRNETFGYPQSYMMYDIAALQRMYGADFTFNAADSVYRWSNMNGQMSINGAAQNAPGANRVFLTVWDGGGNDTYDLSNFAGGVTIDLRPGEWTVTSQVQLANLGNGHYARGNVANALLYNGDMRSLIENGIGGAGNDTLIANQAANHLTGNGGADTFRWAMAGDSRPGSADSIEDFQASLDHIDLSWLDADSRTAADDAFHWIGGSAFSGAAGELRGEVTGGSLHIFADVNADAVADFEIVLAHQATIVDPSAFIF
jgi:serralysin